MYNSFQMKIMLGNFLIVIQAELLVCVRKNEIKTNKCNKNVKKMKKM